jgi:hypothetical protein
MAPRKDQLQIIRRDAAFAASLGIGPSPSGAAGPGQEPAVVPEPGETPWHPSREIEVAPARPVPSPGSGGGADSADRDAMPAPQDKTPNHPERSVAVSVALSLPGSLAGRGEAWAKAAGCSVPFLMRQVAQGLCKSLLGDGSLAALVRIEEVRKAPRSHPASVTLTLPERTSSALAARLDPLGVLGLARAMGPAFRQRFEQAFDDACARAGF